MTSNGSLPPCYYGKRQVVYVQVRTPDNTTTKLLSVYGHTFDQVLGAVDRGLQSDFGKVGSPRPGGRPAGRRRKAVRR